MKKCPITSPIAVSERKLGRERAAGLAFDEDRHVVIDPRLGSKDYLEILLHELLHVLEPNWTEIKVRKTSKVLSKHIWKQRYRRLND